jgi:hypothetical protein
VAAQGNVFHHRVIAAQAQTGAASKSATDGARLHANGNDLIAVADGLDPTTPGHLRFRIQQFGFRIAVVRGSEA